MGENSESQPQNVGFDDFYGFLSVSDMYTEWRDPYFFPEIVYNEARTEWVRNMPFNKCFVHATRNGPLEEVEEVTVPVLSLLDDKWCTYSEQFIERMAGSADPWFLYHCTRGAHFDNYPHPDFLGRSPARHPYKDAIVELDDICGRLVAALERTGQLESTMVLISSDNGPEMETWPDSAFTPFRCAKGSTWEGGVRVPAVVSWPGMIEPGRSSDGLVHLLDLFATCLSLAGAADRMPTDRYIDAVDQLSFLLAVDDREPVSNRKYQHYWLTSQFSALRVGEYKYMLSLHLRRRHRRPQPRRVHGRGAALRLRPALQPLPGPQGDALVHDPQARLHRRHHRRDRAAPGHLPRVAEQADAGGRLDG